MLNDVIESYGGEKVDPLDVYKDILELEKDSFRRSMKIVEVSKQIQLPIIRMRTKIMDISDRLQIQMITGKEETKKIY